MPKPYEFQSELELIQRLKDTSTINAAKAFFAQRSQDINHVVLTGVTGNTFRAFRNLPAQPSATFRQWSINYLSNTQSYLNSISTDETYAKYVHEATISLCLERWLRKIGHPDK